MRLIEQASPTEKTQAFITWEWGRPPRAPGGTSQGGDQVMYYEMFKFIRVSESEKSLCSLQVSFPATALPKERWINI